MSRPVLRDPLVLVILASGVAGLGAVWWALLGRPEAENVDAPGPQVASALRCNACGAEKPYSPSAEGETCSECGEGISIPRMGPAERDEEARRGKGLVFALVVLVVVSGGGHMMAVRVRALRRSLESEKHILLLSRCTYCERKIRYSATKAGSVHVCSRCKTSFVLPHIEGTDAT